MYQCLRYYCIDSQKPAILPEFHCTIPMSIISSGGTIYLWGRPEYLVNQRKRLVWVMPVCTALAILFEFNTTRGAVHKVPWGLPSRHWRDPNWHSNKVSASHAFRPRWTARTWLQGLEWWGRGSYAHNSHLQRWPAGVAKNSQLAWSHQELALHSRWLLKTIRKIFTRFLRMPNITSCCKTNSQE